MENTREKTMPLINLDYFFEISESTTLDKQKIDPKELDPTAGQGQSSVIAAKKESYPQKSMSVKENPENSSGETTIDLQTLENIQRDLIIEKQNEDMIIKDLADLDKKKQSDRLQTTTETSDTFTSRNIFADDTNENQESQGNNESSQLNLQPFNLASSQKKSTQLSDQPESSHAAQLREEMAAMNMKTELKKKNDDKKRTKETIKRLALDIIQKKETIKAAEKTKQTTEYHSQEQSIAEGSSDDITIDQETLQKISKNLEAERITQTNQSDNLIAGQLDLTEKPMAPYPLPVKNLPAATIENADWLQPPINIQEPPLFFEPSEESLNTPQNLPTPNLPTPKMDRVAESHSIDQADLKKMIAYLDELFDHLPPEIIEQFSQSAYFPLYRKIMKDLGL